jgi:HK97 family phage portal protein
MRMGIRNFFLSIGERVTAKRYIGILPGALPMNTKHWGGNEFLSALDVSLYTHSAINKRADKVGEIQFVLKDAKGNDIENDPVLEILRKPNKVYTGPQFWKLAQIYYDTVGEVYILIDGNREIFERKKNIAGLHLLIPTLVTPKFNADGTPSGFEYKTTESTVTYKPEQIIYIFNPDPKHPLRGQSLLKAGIHAITTETQISQYHARVLENGGKVEGVFKFKTGMLTENQLETIKDKYQKEYGSAKKAGLPMFLGGDAEYIKTGLTPDELSFLEAKKMTLEDICILTGVPKSMLASTADVKFDNADADRAIFLRETIKPLLTGLCTALDYALFPDDRNLTFVDPTPENIDQKLKETESGVKNYYMTINEARERHGLDPVANGDDILVPFSLSPLGTEREEEPEENEDDEDKKKVLKTKTIEHPLRDPDIRALYWGMQIKRMEAREKLFKKEVKAYFADQEARLIEKLSPTKTRVFRKKSLLDESLTLEVEARIGKKMFLPLLTQMLKDAGIDALDFAGSKYEFILKDEIVSWLDKRVDVFLNQINETTFAKLQSVFAESLDAGEGREALISRIQETYGGINKARAGLIARTEVHNATQYGTLQGYKQAGLTIKIWVAVRDAYTRDSHATLDGEERPIDRPFSNGLMLPGDPAGSPEEVINCRCMI